jgi:hypothetical protein
MAGATSSSHAVAHSAQEVSVRVQVAVGGDVDAHHRYPTRPRRIRCHDLAERRERSTSLSSSIRWPLSLPAPRPNWGSRGRYMALLPQRGRPRSLGWSGRADLALTSIFLGCPEVCASIYCANSMSSPRPSTAAAAAAADVASLEATAAEGHPCVPSVVVGSRKGIYFFLAILIFGGVYAVPPILWLTGPPIGTGGIWVWRRVILLHGVRFCRTCSTGAPVLQWTRMWLVRVLAPGICSIGAASLLSR